MQCNGNGRCFIKCDCFGLYTLPPQDVLENCHCKYSKAADRSHEEFGYRKEYDCRCTLKKCSIYNHCKQMCPQWVLDTYGGSDINCAMGNTMFHSHEFLNVVDQCPVCYDDKYMIAFGCKHHLCFDCMWTIYQNQLAKNTKSMFDAAHYEEGDVLCPLCRDPISLLKH